MVIPEAKTYCLIVVRRLALLPDPSGTGLDGGGKVKCDDPSRPQSRGGGRPYSGSLVSHEVYLATTLPIHSFSCPLVSQQGVVSGSTQRTFVVLNFRMANVRQAQKATPPVSSQFPEGRSSAL